ncbi:MAG: hypothetical protein JRN37_00470 [Nitrososphaerota archaeon]|nr:hypothetical protein [Nitrososphaerota archaeon]MDG7036907.1 hypothetical protein [Nitrososphaerota archaeon]MDG7037625.1 hypothetical protein [Nitrososphaerota archaeon]
MEKIVLIISCSKKKHNHSSPARDMYDSPLFKMSLKYAEKLNPDKIFILSAKYHLLPLGKEIEPYDVTLNNISVKDVKIWADRVVQELNENTDLENDHFVILAGEKYIKFIRDKLKHKEEPLKGLSMGNRLKFLKSRS